METIGDRFAQFISANHSTRASVASQLNVAPAHITKICKNQSNPSDRLISDFCRKYGVSEAWLRYGEGEMLISRSRNEEIALMVNSIMAEEDDSFRKRLIHSLCALSPDEWKVLEHIAERIKKDP